MLKMIHILTLLKKLMIKDPKFQLGDHVRISTYKKCLLKDMLQIGLKKFL